MKRSSKCLCFCLFLATHFHRTVLLPLKQEAQNAYYFSVILNQLTISKFSHNSFFSLILAGIVVLNHKMTENAALQMGTLCSHSTKLLPLWHPSSFLRHSWIIFFNKVISNSAFSASFPGYNGSTFDSAGLNPSSTDTRSHYVPSESNTKSGSGCVSSGLPTSTLRFHISDPSNSAPSSFDSKILYLAASLVNVWLENDIPLAHITTQKGFSSFLAQNKLIN